MNSKVLHRSFLSALALVCLFPAAVTAQQVVNFGTLAQFTGPGDLDLEGEIVYAVDVNGDMDRTVNGVQFLSDNNPIPGYASTFTHIVTGWETKPEYGDTTDDDNLEEIMHDIRWTNAGVPGGAIGVTMDINAGDSYKLQLLWSGNHAENRRWSVEINDALALEEVQSLAEEGYDIGRSTVYTHEFLAMTDTLKVGYIQGTAGDDPNGILQAVILERRDDLVPGDANEDGVADLADFAIIRDNFRNTDVSRADGDLDFNDTVNLLDFLEWRNAAFPPPAATVPEPMSLSLLALATAGMALMARRRARGCV